MKKKIISLILVLALSLSMGTVAFAELSQSFFDYFVVAVYALGAGQQR